MQIDFLHRLSNLKPRRSGADLLTGTEHIRPRTGPRSTNPLNALYKPAFNFFVVVVALTMGV